MIIRHWAMILLVALGLLPGLAPALGSEPITIGSERQLFVDRLLIEQQTNTRLVLHQPVRREIAIEAEHPWERYGVSYMVTFRDGDRFRAWYRCDAKPFGQGNRQAMTAYAESTDGIHWSKPRLGLVEFDGSKQNNLVWSGPGRNMAVFKDGNPEVDDDERYKALVRIGGDLHGLVSPDGLRWERMRDEPLMTDGPFDSHNIAFWGPEAGQYVAYTRGIRTEGPLGPAMTRGFRGGVRGIRRATSEDFRNWSDLQLIDLGNAPLEHLYTNACVRYPRADSLYLMFSSRYADARKPDPDWPYQGVNDIVLMSSRDGQHFDRTFLEAFVRPGLDPNNWHDRSLYMERGILQTGPTELSMYAMENWRSPSVHIRRLSLRPDGFASVQAGHDGGTLLTKPLTFDGGRLELNVATSAVGQVRVELQDAEGNPVPGFSIDDCKSIYGDQIALPVVWRNGADLQALSGQPVRLRFELRDADLYSFRFRATEDE